MDSSTIVTGTTYPTWNFTSLTTTDIPINTSTDDSVLVAKIVAMIVLATASFAVGLLPLALALCVKQNGSERPRCCRNYGTVGCAGEDVHFKGHENHGTNGDLAKSLLLCFGGGVLLYTTFVHLQPEAREGFARLAEKNIISKDLPIAEIIFCVGFFFVYFIDEIVHIMLERGCAVKSQEEVALQRSVSLRRCSRSFSKSEDAHHSIYKTKGNCGNANFSELNQPSCIENNVNISVMPAICNNNVGNKDTEVVFHQGKCRNIRKNNFLLDNSLVQSTSDNCDIKDASSLQPEVLQLSCRTNNFQVSSTLDDESFKTTSDNTKTNTEELQRMYNPQQPVYLEDSFIDGIKSATKPFTHTCSEHSKINHNYNIKNDSSIESNDTCCKQNNVKDDNTKLGKTHALHGLLTIVALSFHGVFEGLAVGLEVQKTRVWYLLAAIATHKLVIAFCVGAELLTMHAKLYILYMFSFAIVTPIGVGVGIAVSATGSPGNESDVVSTYDVVPIVLQAMAAGTLLYVVFFEVLARERGNCNASGLWQLTAIVVGFTVMSVLQLATGHEHNHGHDHDHGVTSP